jgi:AcrR family transcriptional regulator
MDKQQLLDALKSNAPRDIEHYCEISFGEAREIFSDIVPTALSGNRAAAFAYVSTWKKLAHAILHAVHDAQPDLVLEKEGRLFAVDVKRSPAPATQLLLDAEALEAPFSNWIIRTNDVGLATCAALVQKLREILPDFRPVDLDIHALPHWEHSESDLRAFRRNVSAALNEADPPLERIRQVFDLSLTQLGELFRVSRQAVTQWLESGVPDDRLEKVATVASIADLLDHQLKSERIPGIVRREAKAYGGSSAIDLIRQDRHHELLETVRRSFEWSVPA